MPFLWNDDQSVDEIKHMLVRANGELQCLESEAREEIRKNRETIRQLMELLENVCRERDEARSKLAKAVSVPRAGAGIEMEAEILDKLVVMAKPLPEKGKLMRAVAEAGPLLQSLLIPIRDRDTQAGLHRRRVPLPLLVGESSGSRGFSHIPSSSVLNFGRACLNG